MRKEAEKLKEQLMVDLQEKTAHMMREQMAQAKAEKEMRDRIGALEGTNGDAVKEI